MMVAGNYLLASIVLLALGNALGADVIEGNYNVTQVCTMVPTNTKLGSIASCSDYYLCTTSGPVKTTCESGYYFDLQNTVCNPQSQVKCYYGLDNPCAGQTTNTWVPNLENCQAWYYCESETVAGHGYCPTGQIFYTSTGQCDYGSADTCASNSGTGLSLTSYCEVIPAAVYFGSVTDCQTWQKCTSAGVIKKGNCTSSAFIVQSQTCGYESEQGACDRLNTGGTGGNDVSTTCDSDSPSPKGDASVCGTYYICTNGYYKKLECPSNQYYSTDDNSCKNRQIAETTPGCNRCQYANTDFVNAANPDNCSQFYYCYSDGQKGTLKSCNDDYYFNEADQACVGNSTLAEYAVNNGACISGGNPSTATTDSSGTPGTDDSSTQETTTLETTTENTGLNENH